MSCEPDGTLIIGYGNSLRGDDGVGVCAAERLREAGFHAIGVHQLVPELAERIAGAARVIFIDADAGLAPGEVRVTSVEAAKGGAFEHHVTPSSLLSLAVDVYGSAPPALLVGVGGESHDFGTELSPSAQEGVKKAVRRIVAKCATAP